MKKKFKIFKVEDFKHVQLFRGLNLFVQVFLALLLVAGLNYLAAMPSFQKRWDIDERHGHTISFETRMFLGSLAGKAPIDVSPENPWVRIIVTFPKPSPEASKEESYAVNMLRKRIVALSDDFKYEAGSLGILNLVKFEEADLLKNTRLAGEIKEKGGEISAGTAIVVMSRTRCRTIRAGDLIKVSRDAAGNAKDVDAFRGEEAVMSAILEVTDESYPIVYSLVGDGEKQIDNTDRMLGLSAFAAQLRARHMRVLPLNLSSTTDVPADASMLLIADPIVSVLSRNEEKISRYLRERNGRVLLLAAPGRRVGLEDMLFDWGIQIMDTFVVENDEARIFPDGNVSMATLAENPHKVAEILASQKLSLVASQFREVRVDIGSKEDGTRRVSPLVFSSNGSVDGNIPKSWSERDYRRPPYSFDGNRGDTAGPVPVAMAAERVAGTRLGVNIPGGRIVVVGAGDIASNALLETGGNKPFLMNAVNWLVEREMFLNIPPRPISEFRLNVSMPDLTRVAWMFVCVPFGIMLLGFIVTFWRRRL